jgi:hypothetical protein
MDSGQALSSSMAMAIPPGLRQSNLSGDSISAILCISGSFFYSIRSSTPRLDDIIKEGNRTMVGNLCLPLKRRCF